MDLLADTHVFLWWEWRSRELSQTAREAMGDIGNRVFVSVATVWEISIKRASGRLDFDGDTIAACTASGFQVLPILAEHAELAGRLPFHHTDPFDRMLVAQCMRRGLALITSDRIMRRYDIPVLPATA